MHDRMQPRSVIAAILTALGTFALMWVYFLRLIPAFTHALSSEIINGELFDLEHWFSRDMLLLEAETLGIIASALALSGLITFFCTFILPQKFALRAFVPRVHSARRNNASRSDSIKVGSAPSAQTRPRENASRSDTAKLGKVSAQEAPTAVRARDVFRRTILWVTVFCALQALLAFAVGGAASLIFCFSSNTTSVLQMFSAINITSSVLNMMLFAYALIFLHNKFSTTPLHHRVARISRHFYKPALAITLALAFLSQSPLIAKADADTLYAQYELRQTVVEVVNNERAPNTQFIGNTNAQTAQYNAPRSGSASAGARSPAKNVGANATLLRAPILERENVQTRQYNAQDSFDEADAGVPVAEDETSRTYELPDGTFLTRIYDEPIMQRVQNSAPEKSREKSRGALNGALQEIDTSLQPDSQNPETPAFTPKNAPYNLVLPTSGEGITLQKDDYTLQLQPQFGALQNPVVQNNAIRYNGVGDENYSGVDLQYTAKTSEVKEDIIINHPLRRADAGAENPREGDNYTFDYVLASDPEHPLFYFWQNGIIFAFRTEDVQTTQYNASRSDTTLDGNTSAQTAPGESASRSDTESHDVQNPDDANASRSDTTQAGGMQVKDGATPIFTITAPQMRDNNGETSTSLWLTLEDAQTAQYNARSSIDEGGASAQAAQYKASRSDTSSEGVQNPGDAASNQTLRLTVSAQWLDDPARAYPVVIDPTIFLDGQNMEWHFIENGTPDGNCDAGPDVNHFGNPYLYVGWERGNHIGVPSCPNLTYGATHSFIKINYDWQNLPDNVILTAKLRGYKYTNATPPGATVYAEFVQEPWRGSAYTWNNQPMERARLEGGQDLGGDAKWANWDITEHVRQWKRGAPNYGIMLTPAEEDQEAVVFSGPGNAHGRERFYMDISWRVVDGIDENLPLNAPNVQARVLTKKQVSGMQNVTGVFADGEIRPGLHVDYALKKTSEAGDIPLETGDTTANDKRVFPNSNLFDTTTFDLGIFDRFESNYQTHLFDSFQNNLLYKITARGSGTQTLYDGQITPPDGGGVPDITEQEISTPEGNSDTFIIYKFTDQDTIPFVADFYGVRVDQLILDNKPRDYLAFPGNTWFIRNPTKNATTPYTRPSNLDDNHKRRLIYANNGRGMLSEFDLEPVNTSTGNFYFESTDYTSNIVGKTGENATESAPVSGNSSFNLVRNYNSIGAKDSVNTGQFGRGWSFEYAAHLAYDITQNGDITLFQGDGSRRYFIKNADGSYKTPAGTKLKLSAQKDAEQNVTAYIIIDMQNEPGQKTYTFSRYGNLQNIEDNLGRKITLNYQSNFVKSITDYYGRTFNFTLNSEGNITEITLPNGGKTRYTYENGLLKTFTNLDGSTVRYNYNENGQMTSWRDGNDVQVISNKYDNFGRVTEQTDANGTKTTLQYGENETKITTNIDGALSEKVYQFDANLCTTWRPEPTYKSQNSASSASAYIREIDSNYRILSERDALGNVTAYRYDARGNLTRKTRADGTYQEIIYNSQNLPTIIRDFDANVTQKEYDAAGNVTKITDPDGNFEQFVYDEYGRLLQAKNKIGGVSTFEYNAAPKDLSRTIFTDELGNKTTYYYDKSGNKTREVDAFGNVKTLTYTSAGKPLITYQDGILEEYAYDQNGNAVQIKDALGSISTYTYNAKNELISATDPLGNVTSFAYDLRGNKVLETRPAENGASATTRFEYDRANNLTATIYPDGSKQEQEFDALHRAIIKKDKDGTSRSFQYDDQGNLTRESTALGEKRYEYDASGNVLKEVNIDGNIKEYKEDFQDNIKEVQDGLSTTHYEYNALGKVTSVKQCAQGDLGENARSSAEDVVQNATHQCRETTSEYDLHGNLTSQTDLRGNVITFEYDAENRPVLQVQSGLVATSFEYDARGNVARQCKSDAQSAQENCSTFEHDAKGNVLTQTDALGNATYYEYNALGLLARAVNPLGGAKTFTYNASEQLGALVDEFGNTTQYMHDEMNRPIKEIDALGNVTAVTYNQAGNIASRTDALGNVTTFEYDEFGNLERTIYPGGNIEAYQVNRRGQVLKMCTFDVNARAHAQEILGGNARSALFGVELGTAHNSSAQSYEAADSGAQNDDASALTNCTSYEYDNFGRQISMTNALGQTQTLEYDAFGNVIKRVEFDGYARADTYDDFGQLVQEMSPNGIVTSHEYDNFGREIHSTQTAQDGEMRASTTEYNNFGQVISSAEFDGTRKTFAYDLLGRQVRSCQVGGQTAQLSASHSDTSSEIAQDPGAAGAQICTFTEYNPLGNIASTTDATGYVTQYEVDLAGRQIGQIDPLGNATRTAFDAMNRPIQQQNALGYVTTTDYDALGNVTSVTDPLGATSAFEYDQSGNKVREIDPLGNATNYAYSLTGQLLAETKPNDLQTFYHYDNLGRILEQGNSADEHSSFEYNSSGDLTKTVQDLGDGEVAATQNFYDLSHNLVKTVNPLGGETHNEYDSFGQLLRTVSPNGRVQTSEYDNFGRLAATQTGTQLPVQYLYDAFGRQSATKQGEKITTHEFDLLGNVTKTTDAKGYVSAYIYDALGRNVSECAGIITPESSTDPPCKRLHFDALGQVTRQVDALGNAVTLEYDAAGNNTAITAMIGATLRMNYDAAHQLTSTLDALGRGEIYQYDNMGNMVSSTIGEANAPATSPQTAQYSARSSIVNGAQEAGEANAQNFTLQNAKTTHYQFDALGNQVAIITPERKVQEFQYDFNSKMTAKRQQNGQLISYDYDKLGSLLEVQYDGNSAQNVHFEANSDGRRTKMNDASGGAIYTYNDAGQIASETHQDGKKIQYEYDGYGRLQALATFRNGEQKSRLSYEYDALDRAVSITDLQNRVTKFTYEGSNARPESAQKADGTSTKYIYNLNGQVVKLTNFDANNAVVSEFDYIYNEQNQIAQEMITLQRNNGVEITTNNYKYDEAGQVISWAVELKNTDDDGTEKHILAEEYAYDTFGNRIQLVRKYDGKIVADIAFEYSDDNQLITSFDAVIEQKNEYQYDENGNRKTLQSKNSSGENFDAIGYEYDVENRLIAVRNLAFDQDGSQLNDQNRLLMAATYDGDGNKIFEANRIREVFDTMQIYADDADFGAYDYALANGLNTAVSGDRWLTKYEFERKFDDAQNFFFAYGFTHHLICSATPIIIPLAPICSMIFAREFNNNVLTHYDRELGSADLHISTYQDLFKQDGSGVQRGLHQEISRSSVSAYTPENTALQSEDKETSRPNIKEDKDTTSREFTLPQDPPLDQRDNYELTDYLNDANSAENARALGAYNAQDELRNSYTYSPNSSAPLADFNSPEKAYSTYAFDGRGSVVDTMNDGNASQFSTYSPTGVPLSKLLASAADVSSANSSDAVAADFSATQVSSPGFNAEVGNPLTGLQYLRARYLDVNTGTFMTQDDQFGRMQSVTSQNFYTYAENDGVNKVDPSGHSAQQYFDIMRGAGGLNEMRMWTQSSALQSALSSAEASFWGQLKSAQNVSYTDIAAIARIAGVSQAQANAYINAGIARVVQIAQNYGCTAGSITAAATAQFSVDVNIKKDSINIRIAATKDMKTAQYNSWRAELESRYGKGWWGTPGDWWNDFSTWLFGWHGDDSHDSSVPIIGQDTSVWCWVAAAKMLSEHFVHNNKTQEDAVRAVMGYRKIDNGGTVGQIKEAIQFFTDNKYDVYATGVISETKLKNVLMFSPVIITIQSETMGHAIVIYGFYDGMEGDTKYKIADPLPVRRGSKYVRTYSELKSGKTRLIGIGDNYWRASIYVE